MSRSSQPETPQIQLRQICENCHSYFLDELIKVKICIPNGNTDEEDELNNYTLKTIEVCCVCVAHQRVKGMIK